MSIPLELKTEMKRTYLIQRLRKPVNAVTPHTFGAGLPNGGLTDQAMSLLMNVFSFEYMGAAEFENGAVPEALSFLYEQGQKNNLVSAQMDGVFYICPREYEQEVRTRISVLRNNEYSMSLFEYCGLQHSLNNQNRNTLGWLELNNGFMFFVDQPMFENTKRLFWIS